MAKAVALLSGGLDSALAVMIVAEQGVQIEILFFESIFHGGHGTKHRAHAESIAKKLGFPLQIIDSTGQMLSMLKDPKHGFGKRLNPCMDCRISMLRTAAEQMRRRGADFIITGEVLGQRPMSQRRDSMQLIDREAGVEGLVLRPLSAKLLPPTTPEINGLVDREKFLAIRGRSRKEQMALAESYGIKDYPTPAGGCLLTDPQFALRLRDLLSHGECSEHDVKLLKYGRHFRLDQRTKAIVGRNQADNERLEKLVQESDACILLLNIPGPLTIVRGDAVDRNIKLAAGLTARYSKAQSLPSVAVTVTTGAQGDAQVIEVAPVTADEATTLLIGTA